MTHSCLSIFYFINILTLKDRWEFFCLRNFFIKNRILVVELLTLALQVKQGHFCQAERNQIEKLHLEPTLKQ